MPLQQNIFENIVKKGEMLQITNLGDRSMKVDKK